VRENEVEGNGTRLALVFFQNRLALVAVHNPYRDNRLVVPPSLPRTLSIDKMKKAFKKSKFAKKVKGFLKGGSEDASGDTTGIDPPSRPQSSLAIRPSESVPPTLERRKSDGERPGGKLTLGY